MVRSVVQSSLGAGSLRFDLLSLCINETPYSFIAHELMTVGPIFPLSGRIQYSLKTRQGHEVVEAGMACLHQQI